MKTGKIGNVMRDTFQEFVPICAIRVKAVFRGPEICLAAKLDLPTAMEKSRNDR
jgi:hypothetical protein